MGSARGRLASWVVALSLPLSIAGCASSSSSTPSASDTTTGGQASTEAWAGHVCSAIGHWNTSVSSARSTLSDTQNLSADKLHHALDQISTSTQTLVTDLRQLGPPDIQASDQAKQDLAALGHQIDQQQQKIDQAKNNTSSLHEALTAASTVTAAWAQMLSDAQATLAKLEGLNGGAELRDAFQSSPSCQDLQASASPTS
jgi:hypothetical protein